MVSGPESKGDPGPGVAEISVLIPGQELHLYVIPAPPSNQSFIPDVHLGPHLGPGVFLSHIHIHRLESIIHSLQEMSLPFLGVSVLILRWNNRNHPDSDPTFTGHLLPTVHPPVHRVQSR